MVNSCILMRGFLQPGATKNKKKKERLDDILSCTVHSVLYLMYRIHCHVQCTVYSIQCTEYSVQFTMYSVHGSVYIEHTSHVYFPLSEGATLAML